MLLRCNHLKLKISDECEEVEISLCLFTCFILILNTYNIQTIGSKFDINTSKFSEKYFIADYKIENIGSRIIKRKKITFK